MINLQFDFKQANEEEKALLLKSVDNPSEIERFATTYERGRICNLNDFPCSLNKMTYGKS